MKRTKVFAIQLDKFSCSLSQEELELTKPAPKLRVQANFILKMKKPSLEC